jgi:hypothetical protein
VSRPDLPPVQPDRAAGASLVQYRRKQEVQPPGVALIDTVDGGDRWVPALRALAVRTYYTMAVELARIYYGVDRTTSR